MGRAGRRSAEDRSRRHGDVEDEEGKVCVESVWLLVCVCVCVCAEGKGPRRSPESASPHGGEKILQPQGRWRTERKKKKVRPIHVTSPLVR